MASDITLTGKSGSNFRFEIHPRETEFKNVGAIYVMAKKTSANNYSILYIGQTGNLSSRPLNHHKTDCFDRHGGDTLFVLAEGNESRRLSIESDLIGKYDPPCNG